jgi:FkbM family methyltransferase
MNGLAEPALGPVRRAFALALRALYGRSGLPWAINGETVRIDPRARHLLPHETETALHAFVQSLLEPGDVVLDVGAFAGVHAIMAARKVGTGGRVLAFEPTPAVAALARRHFVWNGVADRVRLVQAAVGDRAGRMTFHQYDRPYVNSLVPAADEAGQGSPTEVDVVTIDDMCRAESIAPRLIRIDVQGAELQALRGARQTIRRAGPRLMLVVEMHPQCWPAFGITENDMRAAIRDLGLAARPLTNDAPLFSRDSHAILTPEARGH